MAEFTTLEIATICEKTERTVQRWLSEGRLKSTHIRGNRYEVNENDLAAFLPHKPVLDYMERLESLEHRVSELESLVQHLSKSKPAVLRPARAEYSIAPGRDTSGQGLPDGWIPVTVFAKQHGFYEKHGLTTIQKAVESERLPIQQGEWKSGRATIKHALDQSGQAKFYEMFHTNPHFQIRDCCPHEG